MFGFRSRWPLLVVLVVSTAPHSPAFGAPVIGTIDKFADGTPGTWATNGEFSNPGADGADGPLDGFLFTRRTTAAQLGARSDGLQHAGNYMAANVTRINLKLNDVDADQNLEIHFSIGNPANFWLYKIAFFPPNNGWGSFSVDLTDSLNFAHIIAIDGQGFAAALQNADRIMVRHDLAPFMQTPDNIAGEFGLDDVELTNPDVGVPLPTRTAALPVQLAAPYPNPARGAVACAFEAFDNLPVKLAVFDAAGRLVRSTTLEGAAPGRRIWMWDGLDEAGRRAPAGAYRVRAVGNAGGTSRPIIRIH